MTDRSFTCNGRSFEPAELDVIERLVTSCSGLSRNELAATVCELIDWQRANGTPKLEQARDLLTALEAAGRIQLPALRTGRPRGSRTRVTRSAAGEPGAPITGTPRDVAPITLRPVATDADRAHWRELIERYHYLGHKVPFGAHLRYLIELGQPEGTVAGCLQLSSPAWKMAPRDEWIGWSDAQRRASLQRIANNSRFLILPWVKVRNLASSVLARLSRQLPDDWERAYAIRPLLIETLVDAERFSGTCYRAANWTALGTTTGRGRFDREHQRHGAEPKHIFVYPLAPQACAMLRGERA